MLYGSSRLPQEWYDRILCPRSGISTPTTRLPTPRVVRSTTSPKKWHKHSNSSVAYPKSGMINYFAQRGTQALQQLGRLPQERHDRLRCPRRGTNTPTTRSSTPRVVQSTTSPKERHKHSKQLGRRPKERYYRLLHPRSDLQYKSVDYPKKSIINSINSTTSQEETSYGKAEKSHKER